MSAIEWPEDLLLPSLRVLSLTNSTLLLGAGRSVPSTDEEQLQLVKDPLARPFICLLQNCPALHWLFLGGSTFMVRSESLPHAEVLPGRDVSAPPRGAPLPIDALPPAVAQASIGTWDSAVRRSALTVEVTYLSPGLCGLLQGALPPGSRLIRLDRLQDAAWVLQAALPAGRWREDSMRACIGDAIDAPSAVTIPESGPPIPEGRPSSPPSQETVWPAHVETPIPAFAGVGHALAFATSAQQGSSRRTPLHTAVARSSQLPHVRVLLRLQALAASPVTAVTLLDRKDATGATPLLRACEEGDVEVVSALLQAGASPSARNQKGETPLYICALRGRCAAVEALSARLSALACVGPDGWTALHAAALTGVVPVIRTLLSARLGVPTACTAAVPSPSGCPADGVGSSVATTAAEADVCASATGGWPLTAGESTCAAEGSGLGVPVTSSCSAAQPQGPACEGDAMDSKGCGLLDARTRYGSTALQIAARAGRVAAVKALLDLGADWRAKDSFDDSARSLAAKMLKRRGRVEAGGIPGAAAGTQAAAAATPSSPTTAVGTRDYEEILRLLEGVGC